MLRIPRQKIRLKFRELLVMKGTFSFFFFFFFFLLKYKSNNFNSRHLFSTNFDYSDFSDYPDFRYETPPQMDSPLTHRTPSTFQTPIFQPLEKIDEVFKEIPPKRKKKLMIGRLYSFQ